MKRPAIKKTRYNRGFTLIEMVVVIAILAVLSVIAIPSYSSYTDKAKQAADRQTADIALNAMVMYCAENRLTNSTMTTEEWRTALDDAKLWPAGEQGLQSAYYTEITLSGPTSGVCTVTLAGAESYIISK